MKPQIALLAALFTAATAAQLQTRRIVFTGSEQVFELKDAAPDLATDWTPYRFLVLELRLSSPQRFEFRVHDAQGVRSVRLSPVAGAWVRSAIPLAFLTQNSRQGMDLASVFQQAASDDVDQPERHARSAGVRARDRFRAALAGGCAGARSSSDHVGEGRSRRCAARIEAAGRRIRPVDRRELAPARRRTSIS